MIPQAEFARRATLLSDRQRLVPVTLAFVYGIGITELLIVLAIVLVILGPKRLPKLGRQLGSGMREFRDSLTRRHEDQPEEEPSPPPARPELPAGDR